MWIFLFLLSLQSIPAPPTPTAPTPSGPPSIIVQAAHKEYLPIIGATVKVKALGDKQQSVSARTGLEGSVEFFVPADADYSIEIKMQNFKNARLKHMHVSKPQSIPHTAYVQLVMKIIPVTVTVD